MSDTETGETSASESEISSPERTLTPNNHSTQLHRRHLSTTRSVTTLTTVVDPQGNLISTTTTEKTTINADVHKKSKGPKKSQFRARTSILDYETLTREDNTMRGFFVLFWMAMAWHVTTTMYQTFRTEGFPFRLNFLWNILDDGYGLAMSDLVLVLSCGMVVVFQKLILWGVIPLKYTTVLQHTWQGIWFSTIVGWCFVRDWPWVQSGFFALHGTSMLMKQHSYMAYNTELHYKLREYKELEAELALLKKTDGDSSKKGESPTETTSPVDRETRINEILSQMGALKTELFKPSVSFPNNITLLNFVDYMLVPTLVYEMEYPRTPKFRPLYFLEKCLATIGTLILLYITVDQYIHPTLQITKELDFFTSLMRLITPFTVGYLCIFYIIFECICNAFAELTCFADREFYDDWWNSCSFDEYARKWNKPVHEFLLRHVYLESISAYKLSKQNATMLTFFVSSCFHELVMAVTGKRVRMYLFMFQMLQIPLIYIARIPFIKKQKTFGNVFFWFGMCLGPPLLAVLYCREHYLEAP
ncbi:hypothetical protein HDV05_003687 [Chytridiales sp. JEL 0842]|nr:hypothetical protein HDV05_003687 [Chytridiales sp. JEL 0842]